MMRIISKYFVFIFLFVINCYANESLVKNGFVNFYDTNFNYGTILPLDGKWEFYWGKFLTPDSFAQNDNRKHLIVDVPTTWKNLSSKHNEINPTGYATYRLRIKVNNGYYFLKIPPIHSSVVVWINGERVASTGVIGTTKDLERPKTIETVIPVSVKNNEIDLVINNSNFHHFRGGLKSNLEFGSGKYFYKEFLFRFIFELFISILFFIIGLFHVTIYLFNNEESKLYNLLFGLLAIFFSIRLLIISSSVLFYILPQINWYFMIRLEWFLAIFVILLGLIYIIFKYPNDSNQLVNKILVSIGSTIAVSFWIIDTYWVTKTLLLIYIYGIVVVLYLSVIVVLAYKNKRRDSKMMLVGLFMLAITLMIEFYYHYVLGIYVNLITIGFLAIMLGHSVNLVLRLINISLRVNNYKMHLEEMIKSRTKELEESKIQLEAKVHQVLLSQGKLQEINDRLTQQMKITKSAQDAMQASEAKFREMADLLPEMVYETDSQLNFTYVNQKAIELFGYSFDEFFKGLNARQLMTSDSAELMILRTFGNPENNANEFTDFEFKRKDGSTFLGWINGRSIEKNGKLTGFRGVVVDISVLRKNDVKIRKLQDFLFNIIDSMPSILIGIDKAKTITLWNKAATQHYGKGHKIINKSFLYDICTELEKYDEKIVSGIESRQIITFKIEQEFNNVKKHENITIYPLLKTNDGAVIRIDDITEQVKMEELLIQSEKMLSVGGLAAGMAHEINNPLAGMMQNANVISNRLQPQNIAKHVEDEIDVNIISNFMTHRKIDKLLGLIIDSGRRAAQIVDNMLSFAKQGKSIRTSENLNELIEETLNLASNDYNLDKKFDFKKIKIIKNFETNLPLTKCEKSKIQQVIFNLIKNSAEATHEKINISEFVPTIEINTKSDSGNIVIEINDNGKGIPAELKSRIFEPFFTTKMASAGTGLGLSVSYFIITKNHNGNMFVESREGLGTNFTILLPLSAEF